MPWYGKGFNESHEKYGSDDLCVPVGKEPETFIPIGKEYKYTVDQNGNWWKTEDYNKMKL